MATINFNKIPFPREAKPEFYERLPKKAVFDRLDLVCSFKPGKDGIGAIFDYFVESIYLHDEIAKLIEEKLDVIDRLTHILNKKQRVFRNWDSTFNIMNTFPAEFEEYLQLKPKMKNFDTRYKKISDPVAKAKAELEYKRFQELLPKCSGLQAVIDALNSSKAERDVAREALTTADSELNALRDKERVIASKISDDHVIADERGIFVGEVFPNVHAGFILCELNTVEVEEWPFQKVMHLIRTSKSPHVTVFRRYDFREHRLTGIWSSLHELREKGVYVDDPRLPRVELVERAAVGDIEHVQLALMKGVDVNSTDHASCTPLYVAAMNGHKDVIDILLKAGANIDSRDANLLTPLLACVRKGNIDIVRYLVMNRAEKTCTDQNNRGALFYAVLSENLTLVRLFLKEETANITENIWGWTPLHAAASKGNLTICDALLEMGSSLYRRSQSGQSPEDVADDTGYAEVSQFLKKARLAAPGQFIYRLPHSEGAIWIGDHEALQPAWLTDTGITAIVMIDDSHSNKAATLRWLRADRHIRLHVTTIDLNDDDEGGQSWLAFTQYLTELCDRVQTESDLAKSNVLICDPTGNSTCAAVFAAFMLLKRQMATEESLDLCIRGRPSVSVSLSLRMGLERMQRSFEEKKLHRLRQKTRTSASASIAF